MNWIGGSEASEGDPPEGRYHETVEAMADLCSWRADLQRGETEWSRAARDMFEIPTTGTLLEHEDVLDFVVAEHEAFVERERAAVFDGEPFDIEYRIEIDGSRKWIHERADIRRDGEGEPVAAIGVLQDVTDHRDRKRELELFRNLVDNASDGFFVVDPETSAIVDVNETACRLLGYEREELLSLSVPDINPAFAEETWNGFVETVRENRTEVIEGEHRRRDGSTFPVEVHVSYVSLDRDYHVATVRDISERKARERRLEAARKRYQTLVDAAPDPIFVADADTGEIVEANASAAELRGQPRDEIVGCHQTELHPEKEADRYRELFGYHVDHSETIREFDDGTPVYLTTADGERIPVAVRTATVSLGDRTLVHGIFRDISEQHRYENALAGINTAARDLLHAETAADIAEIVVDTATDVLNASESGMYLYDDHRGELVPTVYSEGIDEMLAEIPRFSPGDSIAWRVFTDQEQARFDDVRTTSEVYDPDTPIRSELLVPLGEHGVFLVGDTEIGAFGEMTEEITETLCSTAEAALDRADRAQALRKRERKSQLQAERLERVNQLNDEIRTILQALLRADSHEAITQQVCDSLVSLDRFSYAWIGEPDLGADEIQISARAGSPRQYLDAVSLDLAAENTLPAARAARERTTISDPRIAADPHRSAWRNTALAYEFRSVVSVPLVYDEFLYGVMTIYSDRPEGFDDTTRSVLTELGELVGYALNASEQRNALLGVGAADLTFDITDGSDIFVEFAARLETEIQIVNITPRSGDAYLVHFVCEDGDCDRVRPVVEELPSLTELRPISEADPTVYEVVVIGDCLVTTLATVGANVRSVVVSNTHCRITVSIPETQEKGTLIDRLKEEYPGVDVALQRDGTATPSLSRAGLLENAVTDRQQDLLGTAYYSGFFDRQRKRTGTEIADSLGISQPAFSTQLRAAQRNLLASLFEDRSRDTVDRGR